MPALSLLLLLVFLTVVFPVRSIRRRSQFGSADPSTYRDPRPLIWWMADLTFLAGFALVLAGPLLELTGKVSLAFEIGSPLWIPVTALVLLAILLAVWSQEAMGIAWRPEISPADGSILVTGGPFRLVRNPNYLAMLLAAGGCSLLAPTVVGSIGVLLLLAGLILTTRAEESLLLDRYGERYSHYAARTGRFLPGIGLLDEGRPGAPSKFRTTR